ncbi:MAG: LysE family transporter [Acinetobacter sp.]
MDIFFAIALTHFIALLCPGPDFFLLFTTLLRVNQFAAWLVSVGIALGNALILGVLFFILMLLGHVPDVLILLLRILGASYLVYLAWLCYKAGHALHQLNACQPSESIQFGSKLKYMAMGLQSSLLNPKNWMFYSSLILLLPENFTLIAKVCIVIWMVGIVLLWNSFLVFMLSRPQCLACLQRCTKTLYFICACCFVFFAILLCFV